MSKSSCIKQTGVLVKALGSANFEVELDTGHKVLCTLAGKMRQHFIKVLPGDKVEIEISPYDLSRGRISRRLR